MVDQCDLWGYFGNLGIYGSGSLVDVGVGLGAVFGGD